MGERGQDVVQKNLFRNFCLHLVNLFEFGVIGPAHVFTAISRLQTMVRSLGLQHDLSWGGHLTSLSPRLSAQSPNSRKSAKFRKNFAGIFSKSGSNSASRYEPLHRVRISAAVLTPIKMIFVRRFELENIF